TSPASTRLRLGSLRMCAACILALVAPPKGTPPPSETNGSGRRHRRRIWVSADAGLRMPAGAVMPAAGAAPESRHPGAATRPTAQPESRHSRAVMRTPPRHPDLLAARKSGMPLGHTGASETAPRPLARCRANAHMTDQSVTDE